MTVLGINDFNAKQKDIDFFRDYFALLCMVAIGKIEEVAMHAIHERDSVTKVESNEEPFGLLKGTVPICGDIIELIDVIWEAQEG